jgi:DNA-binding LacI/PurR family transcriptional regulator
MSCVKSKQVTLADVARAAGVSTSTASEALTGRGRVSPATRAAIRETALALGYRPNGLARSLRTGRTLSIGLHQLAGSDRFAAQYTREFAAGAIEVVHQADYDLTMLATDTALPRARLPHVDGIIIADPIANDVRARELLESGIPVVAGEYYPPGMPSSPVVAVDHATVMRALLDHAYERGARRPLLVGPDENSGWGTMLHAVYSAWCAERGLAAAYQAIDFLAGFAADGTTRDALASRPDADLLLVPGEGLTIAALDALRERGLAPGRDVLVASCSDATVLAHTSPPVTAIDLSPRDLGAACAAALIAHLAEGAPLVPLTLLPGILIMRASTEGRCEDCDVRALHSPFLVT